MTRGDDRRDPLVIFRAPAPLKERLAQHAATTGRSVSETCREAIEAHLNPIQVAPGIRFQPVTEITDELTGTKHRVRKATPPTRTKQTGKCEHRVAVGSFCRRCDRVVV